MGLLYLAFKSFSLISKHSLFQSFFIFKWMRLSILRRIMEISDNTLLDLPNSSYDTKAE